MLGGPDARRGLSLSTHVIVAGLDFGAGRRLSAALCGPHPLLRHHLIAVASE